MAGELLQAVTANPYEPGKALRETFMMLAEVNYKRKALEVEQKSKAQELLLRSASLELREKALEIGQGNAALAGEKFKHQQLVDSHNTEVKLREHQRVNEFTEDLVSATKDGVPLLDRLQSDDPAVRDEAATIWHGIRTKYAATQSIGVRQTMRLFDDMPAAQAKLKIAQEAEERRQRDSEGRNRRGDRGLELREESQEETARRNREAERLGERRIENAEAGTRERARHNAVNEEARTKSKIETGETAAPDPAKMSMAEIRRTLARGSAKYATDQDRAKAARFRQSLLHMVTGRDKEGSPIFRYTPEDVDQMAKEGMQEIGEGPRPAASVRFEEGDLPTAGPPEAESSLFAPQPSRAPALRQPTPKLPTVAPTPTPTPTPSPAMPSVAPSRAQQLLQKYKIQPPATTPNTSLYTPTDDPYGATQRALSILGLAPQSPQPTGFGGFGLPQV